MPGYIKAVLQKYQHPVPMHPEHAPHKWNPPVYGAKTQYVEDDNNSPALSAKNVIKLQQFTGTLLYYAREVDALYRVFNKDLKPNYDNRDLKQICA
jgi:hypothetical protein